MQRKDFRFDKLLAGEYEPKVQKKRKKTVEPEYQQMSLLGEADSPNDEGEFLTSYITDYRRVQDYGK